MIELFFPLEIDVTSSQDLLTFLMDPSYIFEPLITLDIGTYRTASRWVLNTH